MCEVLEKCPQQQTLGVIAPRWKDGFSIPRITYSEAVEI
jgi:hypothetical protein